VLRSITASSTSTGYTFFLLIIAASSVAGIQASLASGIWVSPWVRLRVFDESRAPPSASAQPRIERVAERVAEQVRAEYGEADRDAREEHEVRRLLGVLGRRDRQHPAPRWVWLGDPEPEERQGRLDQDRAPELRRAQDDEGAHRVGQDVAKRDAQVPHAQRAR